MTTLIECRTAHSDSPTTLSAEARDRILSVRGEPLFYGDWLRAMFIHYEVDAEALQREVPYPLDLWEGRAYVSLVAFTLRGMRPRLGGKLGALLFRPIATHEFLNVRAYVKHGGESGIFFLAEWLSNPISVRLGPPAFGLPYRHGGIKYVHEHETGHLQGTVDSMQPGVGRLDYLATMEAPASFVPCAAGSLDEFLVERYTAFTTRGSRRRFFHIWHPPWPQRPVDVVIRNQSLLTKAWPWISRGREIGANYSPGVEKVWMGRPQRL
jgi:uncharacterized protein YqjF (DUF2071 family)